MTAGVIVFWEWIGDVSRCGLADFETHTQTLPVTLLDLARQANPGIEARARALDRLREHLVGSGAPQPFCRDPEVYYPIFSLIDRAPDVASTDALLRRLRWTLGLSHPRDERDLPDGYIRLRHPEPALFRARDGELHEVTEPWRTGAPGLAADVWLPRDGLFNDMLDARLYPPVACPPDDERILGRLARAVALIRAHSAPLADDVDRAVRTIVLLPDWPERHIAEADLRWSYNMRFRYFGGIFLNAFRTDELGIAEGLVHEYLHLRMWQWWQLEKPSGIPRLEDTVVSPVTSTEKSACVMVHALMIYVVALDLYRRAILGENASASPVSEASRRRAARLDQAIPELHRRLLDHVPPGTAIRTLIDGLRERHATWLPVDCREV